MAISTINDKLAIMEWDNWFEPGLPMSPGTIGTDDQQQLILGYPGVAFDGELSEAYVLGQPPIGPRVGIRPFG